MKKYFRWMLAVNVIAALFMVSCEKTEDDGTGEGGSTQNISGLYADLSSYNGRVVSLKWDSIDVPSYSYQVSVYRRAGADGEFELLNNRVMEYHFTDATTQSGQTYYYYVNYKAQYSDTIPVETAAASQPFLTASARVAGEASGAWIQDVMVKWSIGATADIDKYEIYRDGQLVKTVNSSYEKEYYDASTTFAFDTEYAYYMIAYTNSGEQYQSLEKVTTPRRPDAVERQAPEITKVTSSRIEKTIHVSFSNVSKSEYNLIQVVGELEGLNYSWDFQKKVNECATDGDDLVVGMATSATLPTGVNTWLNVKVRIYVDGGWSDWSLTKRTFVF